MILTKIITETDKIRGFKKLLKASERQKRKALNAVQKLKQENDNFFEQVEKQHETILEMNNIVTHALELSVHYRVGFSDTTYLSNKYSNAVPVELEKHQPTSQQTLLPAIDRFVEKRLERKLSENEKQGNLLL